MTTGKTLLSEGQIKEIIREEFASQGVVLTEEQLEELFGMFGKSKIIKHIMKMDPDGSKLDKMGYDSRPEALKALGKKALKGLASELQAVTSDDDEGDDPNVITRAASKVWGVFRGVLDIGILRGGAGTLLGGEETFDIKKRKALKGTAKKQIEDWLKKLNYEPLLKLYATLGDGTADGAFPNNGEPEFKNSTIDIMNEYDQVVKAFEEKGVDCPRANTIIAVLRALVIYYQDFAMSDKNFYVNEQEEPEQEEKMGADQGSVSKNFIAAYGNKLPLGLAATGVACLAVGFVADSEFFQNFLKSFIEMEKIPGPGQVKAGVEATTGALLGNIESGEGIIKVVRRLGGPEMAQFGTAGGPGMGALAKAGPLVNLLSQAMISPQGPAALAQAIAKNANPAQLFVSGPMSGTAKAGEELFGLNKGPFNEALSNLIDSEMNPLKSVAADTIKNQFLTGLGTYLGPVLKFLGLSLLIAALASFTMRQKGKGKMGGSRMSKLKGMVDEMVDIPCDEKEDEKCPDGSDPPCEDEPPPPPEDPCKDKPGTKWNPETEECEEDIEIVEPREDQDITIIDTNTWIQLVQQITKNETNQTVINNITNITNNIEKHDTTVNVDDRDIVQNIIKVTQKNDIDINNRQLSQNQINQLIQILGRKDDLLISPPKDPETPEDPATEDIRKVMKPILIRYDDDEIKIYAPRIPSKEKGKEYVATMKDAEKKGLIGNEVSSALNEIFAEELTEDIEITEADTGETEKALETRGFRWDPKKSGALTMAKLNKRYKTRRKNKRTGQIIQNIPKYFFTFDKSLISALAPLDVGSNETRAIAKLLIKILKRNKKITVSHKQLTNLVSKIEKAMPNIAGDADGLTKILSDFSVTIPSKNEKLQEALVAARWKVLSGIK